MHSVRQRRRQQDATAPARAVIQAGLASGRSAGFAPRSASGGCSFGVGPADRAIVDAEGARWQVPFLVAMRSLAEAALHRLLVLRMGAQDLVAHRAIIFAERTHLEVPIVVALHSRAEATLKLTGFLHVTNLRVNVGSGPTSMATIRRLREKRQGVSDRGPRHDVGRDTGPRCL